MTSPSVFAPWLLTGEVTPKKAERVRGRLLEALRGRPFPLHVNVLWNVLYWNWLPDSKCYERIQDDNLLERPNRRNISGALPIGVLVKLNPGEKELWGEVVYKERVIPPLDQRVCPWEVDEKALHQNITSGYMDERLVLDFESSLIQGQQELIEREIHRRRLLDEYGHITLRTQYDGADAGLDDSAFFVEYLLVRHGPALIREYSRADLTEEQARGALHQSLQSIRNILATTPGLRSWGDYWFLDQAFHDEMQFHDGQDRMREVHKSITRLPSRQSVGSHAVTLALREYLSRASSSTSAHDLLCLTGHVARICHINAYLAQRVGIPTDGYAVCEIARRVNGGVWRTQRLSAGTRPAYLQLPPHMEIPFGRTSAGVSLERATDLLRDVGREPPLPDIEFRVKRCDFKVALSQIDLNEGHLRLGRAIELLDGQFIQFRLSDPKTKDEIGASLQARVDHARQILTGIDWFSQAYAGLCVKGTIEDGSRRLDAYVIPLPEPALVEGTKEPLRWEFDYHLWQAALRAARKLPAETIRKAKSPADLLAAAFRRVGEQRDGWYVASLAELYLAIVREGAYQPPDLDFAQVLLAELIESPLVAELPDGRFAYWPRAVKGMSSLDPTSLGAWSESEAGRRLRSAVYNTESWIQPFYISRRQYKHHESWERARASFKEAAKRDHAYRFMHMDLPEGYSYTRANIHHRRKNGG